ncbi:MAG TPA: GTP cyclohydrolase II [Candidatus Thermoplasmatota archaeon]|jgi:GTP cyclohydrolase II|nr:GTP cyclohydrolase II [Candidatus Thermoplasmatota archaeon]
MAIPKPTLEQVLDRSQRHDCSKHGAVCVRIAAVAELPTRYGQFQVVAYHSPSDGKEHAALVRGDVVGKKGVPVRLHSECLTGDVFTSQRCDCREQLERAMEEVGQMAEGIILYLRQEGRGIGFVNKIKAYQLQEWGYDTNQANEALGFRADERDYEIAARMLAELEVASIKLMSNNPDKIADLKAHGVKVAGRIPIVIPPNPHNLRYLETKREKSGHLLPPLHVPEQVDSAHRTSDTAA